MAITNTANVQSATPALNIPFGRVFDRLVQWVNLSKTRRALSQLSDRQLADIGLTRSDIDNLSAHTLSR